MSELPEGAPLLWAPMGEGGMMWPGVRMPWGGIGPAVRIAHGWEWVCGVRVCGCVAQSKASCVLRREQCEGGSRGGFAPPPCAQCSQDLEAPPKHNIHLILFSVTQRNKNAHCDFVCDGSVQGTTTASPARTCPTAPSI